MVLTVSVSASPTPFLSNILPLFGAISLSLVCCSYALLCKSSPCTTCIYTTLANNISQPILAKNKNINNLFFISIVIFSIKKHLAFLNIVQYIDKGKGIFIKYCYIYYSFVVLSSSSSFSPIVKVIFVPNSTETPYLGFCDNTTPFVFSFSASASKPLSFNNVTASV